MIINPQIVTTPDCPTVIIREPEANVDLESVVRKILNSQGWGLGTYFHVQFVNHERTRLLKSGLFVVTEDDEQYKTSEVSPQQTMSRTVFVRKAMQVGDWLVVAPDKPAEGIVKWNPGKQAYDVKVGDKVVATDTDKEKAQAIAKGELVA